MSLISYTQLQDGVTGVNAAATNTPLNTIYNDYNGNITDANIAANGAIAFSKVAGGTNTALTAGISWTPSYVGFTLNNGTVNYAKSIQIGKIVSFRLKITIGSTTAVGSAMTISLPVTASSDYAATDPFQNTVIFYDVSATTPYNGTGILKSTTTMALESLHTDGSRGNYQDWTGSDPFTFAVGDIIYVSGSYESA